MNDFEFTCKILDKINGISYSYEENGNLLRLDINTSAGNYDEEYSFIYFDTETKKMLSKKEIEIAELKNEIEEKQKELKNLLTNLNDNDII